MDPQAFMKARLDRGAVPLAVGDVLALVVLLTIGTLNHLPASFLIDNPTHLLGVYAPFLIGWLLMAPLIGAYSAGAVETAKSSIPLVIRSWVPASVLGFVLREFVFAGGASPVFVAIIFVTGLIALGGWRALYFKLRG